MPPPAFENDYRKGEVKTVKDCWTCRKNTVICLMTANYASGGDFFYICASHLKDHNFATPVALVADSPSKPDGVSQADIDQAIKEYQDRQKSKEKEKEPGDKEKEDATSKEKDKATGPSWVSWLTSSVSTAVSTPESPITTTPQPEPTQFKLHKDFFEMRLRLHQSKIQAKEAQSRRAQLDFPKIPAKKPS